METSRDARPSEAVSAKCRGTRDARPVCETAAPLTGTHRNPFVHRKSIAWVLAAAHAHLSNSDGLDECIGNCSKLR